MARKRAPKPAVIEDRGENISKMEPLLISQEAPRRGELVDLAVELAAQAVGFKRSIPEGMLAPLIDLVRSMNCYYSNIIEGHYTHPLDIERALNNDYTADKKKRDLQQEAKAHITVQRWIDQGGLRGRAANFEGLREIHREFCSKIPDELLWVEDPETRERVRVVPGEPRDRFVMVGRHKAISPGAVPRFMRRYEEVYSNLGRSETIIAAAASHHRFLWIHPFLDGNGRVARLASHAIFLETLDTGGIWSIARGLARSVDAYKQHLAACDSDRHGDRDGRGALSESNLTNFTIFFLKTCLDQVQFMEKLMQPDQLRSRVLSWAEEESKLGALPAKSGQILEAILYRGQLPRADIPKLLQVTERQALRIVTLLHARGVLTSLNSRAPWRLAFPVNLAQRWMPGLYPEASDPHSADE